MAQDNKSSERDHPQPTEAEAPVESQTPVAPTDQPKAAAPAGVQPAAAPAGDELALLRQEVAELREKNLRLLAELQNQQKRFMREREEALRYAEAGLARELLVVLDDLERTLAAAGNTPDVASLTDGVRIVYEPH